MKKKIIRLGALMMNRTNFFPLNKDMAFLLDAWEKKRVFISVIQFFISKGTIMEWKIFKDNTTLET